MSRFLCAVRRASAPIALTALLGIGTLSAQVLLYVPAQGSNQLYEYGINSSGIPFNYPTVSTGGNNPNTIATTPNNRFMYVGESDGRIDVFVVGYDGVLTDQGAPFANAGSVRGLAVDPSGQFLYASDNTGGRIVGFSINQTTGKLTQVSSIATPVGAQPRGVAIDSAGHLYVAFAALNQVGQYSIDSTTGALTAIGPPAASGTVPDRVVVSPNGQNVYVSNFSGLSGHTVSIFTVGAGGALSAPTLQSTGPVTRPLGLAIHPNGFLIVTLNAPAIVDNVLVFRIGAGGALTQVATGSTTGASGANATGVTVDPSGQFIYVANDNTNSVTKFNIDGSSGALTSPFQFATGTSPQFLLSKPAPTAPAVPAASTWTLALLGMLLAATSAVMYRRAYR